jgi:hypothetical protein
MKILLVAEREELGTHIRTHFQPHGSELIQYWNPIKAMDNIDEVAPDVVLFSARDFPRQWKTFVNFLRGSRSKHDTVFVLLKGDDLPYEEASKAQHLDVNGIVHENLEDRQELGRLRELVMRYKNIEETRKERRLIPGPNDRLAFAFTHPNTMQIITGSVEDISASGLRFMPTTPEAAHDIEVDQHLAMCSLRLGEELLQLACRVVRHRGSVSVTFDGVDSEKKAQIADYIERRSERELQAATSTHGDASSGASSGQ